MTKEAVDTRRRALTSNFLPKVHVSQQVSPNGARGRRQRFLDAQDMEFALVDYDYWISNNEVGS